MPGPGDQMAPGTDARGRLRVSDADRDQAVDALKAAFVRGQLGKEEFDLRVGQVLTARTYADLDAFTVGIQSDLSPSDRSRTPALSRIAQAAWTRRRLACAGAGLLLLVAGMMLASTAAFICGMLIVGVFAPQAVPLAPEAAMVRTWQRLHRHEASDR